LLKPTLSRTDTFTTPAMTGDTILLFWFPAVHAKKSPPRAIDLERGVMFFAMA